ncbi:MAG: hypothetical protein O7C98_14630 [Planctomycetota bacterium]|nr:hypothetical protein [Planctomycetota bacterium]
MPRCTGLALLIACFALAAPVRAGEKRGQMPVKPEEVQAIQEAIGAKAWEAMSDSQKRVTVMRYRQWQRLPAEKREGKSPKRFLLRRDRPHLPRPLVERLEGMDRRQRMVAERFLMMRWRHMEIDDALRRIPFDARWQWFDRLFPEPFDPRAAREANHNLRKFMARQVAMGLRPHVDAAIAEVEQKRGAVLEGADRKKLQDRIARELMKKEKHAEETRRVRRLVEELDRWFGADAPRRGSLLPHVLARNKLRASPRERELIRYALMPGDCPLLDPERIAGPLPEDPEALPQWQRDFEVLARLELLSQCRMASEGALGLASSTDAAELLAGLRGAAHGRRARAQGRKRQPSKGDKSDQDD